LYSSGISFVDTPCETGVHATSVVDLQLAAVKLLQT